MSCERKTWPPQRQHRHRLVRDEFWIVSVSVIDASPYKRELLSKSAPVIKVISGGRQYGNEAATNKLDELDGAGEAGDSEEEDDKPDEKASA
ncbi:hypothetical protein BGZ46_002745 [Entomortierella lignicola]|nr:hypothetical protein BGZ46_002745 [Entomortierella lignicola]